MQKRPAIQPETLVHAVGEFCNRFWGKPMFHSVKPIRVLSGSFLGVVLFGGLCGCDAKAQRAIQAATSKAKGAVMNLEADHDSRIVNDEFDYGLKLTFVVRNMGESGIIRVSPWVSCSEGEWSRAQNLHFNKGEAKRLEYFFHEPTINASNIQYGVKVYPNAF